MLKCTVTVLCCVKRICAEESGTLLPAPARSGDGDRMIFSAFACIRPDCVDKAADMMYYIPRKCVSMVCRCDGSMERGLFI